MSLLLQRAGLVPPEWEDPWTCVGEQSNSAVAAVVAGNVDLWLERCRVTASKHHSQQRITTAGRT